MWRVPEDATLESPRSRSASEGPTSDVLWVDASRMSYDNSVGHKLARLVRESGAAAGLPKDTRVALKVNTAEEGYEYGLRPSIVRVVAAELQEATGKAPAVCDGLKLVDYWSGGKKGHSFLQVARGKGYSNDTLGGSFLINGGFSGDEGNLYSCGFPDSELGGVEVGAGVCRSQALWVLSHVTLHPLFGLAGALWNGGFECLVGRERMRVLDGVDAYPFSGPVADADALRRFRRRALESHLGVRASVGGRVAYINALWDVTPRPEYFPFSEAPIAPNLGFLLSRDPVALDAATLELLEPAMTAGYGASPGEFREVLRAAESLGLGSAPSKVQRLS